MLQIHSWFPETQRKQSLPKSYNESRWTIGEGRMGMVVRERRGYYFLNVAGCPSLLSTLVLQQPWACCFLGQPVALENQSAWLNFSSFKKRNPLSLLKPLMAEWNNLSVALEFTLFQVIIGGWGVCPWISVWSNFRSYPILNPSS